MNLGTLFGKNIGWGRLKNYKKVIELISKLLELSTTIAISSDDLYNIENLAVDLDLTFYDASYVYFARKLGLKLLTQDKKILEKAGDIAIEL